MVVCCGKMVAGGDVLHPVGIYEWEHAAEHYRTFALQIFPLGNSKAVNDTWKFPLKSYSENNIVEFLFSRLTKDFDKFPSADI